MWGVWNFVLMHGKHEFYSHWLFFTDIDMLNDVSGDEVLESDTYKQVLISMVIAGVATSIKRTILALYL